MTQLATETIESQMRACAAAVNATLARHLANAVGVPDRLAEAMRYSIECGGKRLRPALVQFSCRACGESDADALPAAAAIECVHTFSLIHDDLPAMDDDDLRRGRPTNHRVFGEGMAVLAGDGLLALAFEILAEGSYDAATRINMVRELARATGWTGMIGGQAEDLGGETQPADAKLVARIHAMKTARLMEAACRLGGLAARTNESRLEALGRYGLSLGQAFQIADDLLDVTATTESLGKRSGKDEARGKQTYPRAIGVDGSRQAAQDAVCRAREALEPFGSAAEPLMELANYVVNRRS